MTYLKRSGSDQTVALNSDVLVSIDLNQVFHLHNVTNKSYCSLQELPKELISDVNSILDIDESDKVLKPWALPGDKEVYNMSIDIFVVDPPFLIEKLEEEAAKEEPRKLRYVLRDFGSCLRMSFAYEHTGYLSNIHSVKSYFDANLDMLNHKEFYSLLHQTKEVHAKLKWRANILCRLFWS